MKPLVEIPAAAAGIGEDETSLVDELASFCLAWGSKLGCFVAVEEDDRGLEHLLNGRDLGVDDLPGEQVLPVVRDDRDDVANIVRVVVPVRFGRMGSLLIKTGARPLARKSSAKLVATSSFSWPPPARTRRACSDA